MEEIWKDVVGYEGYYQVSNLGRVRSLDRQGIDGRNLKGKVLTQRIRSGYWSVALTKEGHTIDYSVHRLVAEAFLPNPNNLPQVSHKDEHNFRTSNQCNNNVDNLEWATAEYNSNTFRHLERLSNSRIGMKFTDEHRRHISESQTGKKRKPPSKETREKISKALTGKTASAETKNKLSLSHKGKTPSNAKRVICENIEYSSMSAFCKIFHIGQTSLQNWLDGTTIMPQEWQERGLRYAE